MYRVVLGTGVQRAIQSYVVAHTLIQSYRIPGVEGRVTTALVGILSFLSGPHMGSIHEEKNANKSRDTATFNSFLRK